MKIYVAGKWKERMQVRKIMDMFEAMGYTITCDWTKHIAPERIQKGEGCFNKDFDWAQDGHQTYAQEDLDGVRNCDVIVAYMPRSDIFYKGAWIEVGIAIAFNKRVILIGNDITTVFLGLPNVTVVSFKEEALDLVNKIRFNNEMNEVRCSVSDHFVM